MGGLVVWRREPGKFSAEIVNLLQTFATQSVLANENARLFREIEEKGREIEEANRQPRRTEPDTAAVALRNPFTYSRAVVPS